MEREKRLLQESLGGRGVVSHDSLLYSTTIHSIGDHGVLSAFLKQ